MSTSVSSSSELEASRTAVMVSVAGVLSEVSLCAALVTVLASHLRTLLCTDRLRREQRDVVLFSACGCMFLLAIAHVGIDLHIVVTGGILKGLDLEGLAKAMSALQARFNYLKFMIYVLQTFSADAFMVYRAFVVWNSSWLTIALPIVLLVGVNVLGIILIVFKKLAIDTAQVTICTRVFFLMTVVTNLVSTLLVLTPLLTRRRDVYQHPPKHQRTMRRRVVSAIMQSAAVFTLSALSFSVGQFVPSPLVSTFLHFFFPSLVSLAFTLTIARICLPTATSSDRDARLRSPVIPPNYSSPQYYPYTYTYLPSRHAHSQSCPSLPIVDIHDKDRDGDGDLDRMSARSQPIEIRVEVSTTRMSDGGCLAAEGNEGVGEGRDEERESLKPKLQDWKHGS